MARSSVSNRFEKRNIPYSIAITASANSGLVVPYSASLNPTSQVTLEMWFYLESFNSTTNVLFDNSTAGVTNSYYLDILKDGGIRWFSTINGSGRNITTTATKVQLHQWNFIRATFTGTDIKIFLNGAQLDETITGLSGSLGTNTNDLYIGRSYSGSAGSSLIGYIFRPRIFNVGVSLAESQVKYYTASGEVVLSSNVLHLNMTEGAGSTIADSSSSANNATITGSASWNSTQVPFKSRSSVSNRSVVSGRATA